jgi:hypothetical protein
MTASTGVGPGGRREGAGRPFGAINKKARSLLIQAEYEGLLTPVEFLLAMMRNDELPLRDRAAAAVACAPYLHPRLSMIRVGSNHPLSDEALVAQVVQLEKVAAAMPEHERVAQLEDQLDHTLDEVQQLPPPSRESLLRKLAEAAEAGLRGLNDAPPGAVLRRPSDRHQPSPEPPADQRYDPRTWKLLPVA